MDRRDLGKEDSVDVMVDMVIVHRTADPVLGPELPDETPDVRGQAPHEVGDIPVLLALLLQVVAEPEKDHVRVLDEGVLTAAGAEVFRACAGLAPQHRQLAHHLAERVVEDVQHGAHVWTHVGWLELRVERADHHLRCELGADLHGVRHLLHQHPDDPAVGAELPAKARLRRGLAAARELTDHLLRVRHRLGEEGPHLLRGRVLEAQPLHDLLCALAEQLVLWPARCQRLLLGVAPARGSGVLAARCLDVPTRELSAF
mmetsp:Transcript_99535/g.259494  ORF Transcript_99535/g.259494 Transcript_99535/m.259494 type:complete len:258 (-) Transcript_99535:422-1195(-)